MNMEDVIKFLLAASMLSGCAYHQFPPTWQNVYVKEHRFSNATVCEVIDAIREDTLPALEHAGINGYSVVLQMIPNEPSLMDQRFSFDMSPQPLGHVFILLGERFGLEVNYECGVVILKEKANCSR